MHKIFVTDGVVLGKRGVGEANTLVSLLTEELGLVRVSARSARFEKSKLRYGLETLTRARYSLVRGKYEWKLTGAEGATRELVSGTPMQRQRAGKIARLLLRLIHGEEPVPAVYHTVVEGFSALANAPDEAAADAIESVIVLRVIAHLGYLPHIEALNQFIEGEYSVELSAQALRDRALLVRTINESLSATGL